MFIVVVNNHSDVRDVVATSLVKACKVFYIGSMNIVYHMYEHRVMYGRGRIG